MLLLVLVPPRTRSWAHVVSTPWPGHVPPQVTAPKLTVNPVRRIAVAGYEAPVEPDGGISVASVGGDLPSAPAHGRSVVSGKASEQAGR